MQAEITTKPSTKKLSAGRCSVLNVAIPAPLYKTFDYALPPDIDPCLLKPGYRVRVPFGRRSVVGVILSHSLHSVVPEDRLKTIESVLDQQPLLSEELLALLNWTANYYLHPIGEVVQAALPSPLRQGKAAEASTITLWKAIQHPGALDALQNAPKQQQLLSILMQSQDGMDASDLNQKLTGWRTAMQALISKNLVSETTRSALPAIPTELDQGPELNSEQQTVVDRIAHDLDRHLIYLLLGVTGSGKTEVYLHLAQHSLSQNKQVLVLVPEISLTPQLTQRFQQRFQQHIAILHSGLNDQQRLNAWLSAAKGQARLIIGTRSAIFTPAPDLGLIIVDEEHDGSYKQQDSFSYNARDLALVRAHRKNIPVVLGSATPSLESLYNVQRERYQLHRLSQRARNNTTTQIELIDLRNQPMQEGLSEALLSQVGKHLENGGQVLLFINRRGFSPLLMCHDCGWTTQCRRCDAHMTFHKHKQQLHCHHCAAEAPAPTQCGHCQSTQLIAIGTGTQRIEQYLEERFPGIKVGRIDRDTTRTRGSLEDKLQSVHDGDTRILVGTQMLAKGHDFPNITLVGILDSDQALYSADFRAPEHLAQLITQVAGRAGRADKAGTVMIQTHHPEHPLLQTLLHQGYESYAADALQERELIGLPPHKHLVLLRCAAIKKDLGWAFMQQTATILQQFNPGIDLFGPVPAPMEKRAGRYRSQIMLQATDRKPLHQCLRAAMPVIQQLKLAKQVRWSVDVDPYDTY